MPGWESGLRVHPGEASRLKAEFEQNHCFRIRRLLNPPILALLQRRLAAAEFGDNTHAEIGRELLMRDAGVSSILHFVINTPAFLEALREISSLPEIKSFTGRVFKLLPGPDHYTKWHNDLAEGRLIGMSLNLTPEEYSGGIFMIRERRATEPLCEVANTGFGDANFFRISPALVHQVTPVTGTIPRTAFAGWFYGGRPDYHSELRRVATLGVA